MRIDRCLIDANWGQSTDMVYQFCRQSVHSAVLLPSHGKYVGASSVPLSEYRRKRGDRVGLHWRIPNTVGRRQVRHALIDTNYWKSFVHARLAVAMGDPGCLSLFGRKALRPGSRDGDDANAGRRSGAAQSRSSRHRASGTDHRLLADHLTAEYRVKTLARDRTVDEWKLRPTRPDNHWLDCLVGCAVAASIQGAALAGIDARAAAPRRRVRLSEIQRSRR